MTRELTPEELAIIGKVEKLLRLAGNNPNEHEAALASEKAMALLEAYNLDMMILEKNTGKTGKRSDTKFSGGLYPWKRNLWNAVAELHFCKYWFIRGLGRGQQYQHRVLGRQENVVAMRVMAEYLQQTVERLAREWAGSPHNYFTKSAISYRDGLSNRLVTRLANLRQEKLEADERKKREDAARARHPGAAAPSTALTVVDVMQAEEDANNDFLYGEGWSAKRRAERAKANKDWDERMAAAEKWRAEHPEEAKRQEEERARRNAEWQKAEDRKAKRRKGVTRTSGRDRYKGDANAFWEGHRKGDDIGLDQQVSHDPSRRVT